jgi:hypothetical protein
MIRAELLTPRAHDEETRWQIAGEAVGELRRE